MTESERLVDAVCAYVEHLEDHIERFEQALQINELGRFPVCSWGETRLPLVKYLSIRMCQLAAVMEVHHDAMDAAGCTSWLFRITALQDKIAGCLDLIDSPSTITND